MIFLDSRAGSKDYEAPLRALGAPVETTIMDFGDAAFFGSGAAVGIELKKLNDILACITTGRFSGHQLPGLVRTYQEVYLILEGLWRPNPYDGVLESFYGGWKPVRLGKKSWMWRDFTAYLSTIEVKGGVRVWHSGSEDETARMIYALYQWWQHVDEHRSHLAVNRAGRDVALYHEPTLMERIVAELPGVGYMKAGMIAGAFPDMEQLMAATSKDLQKLPGIGKVLAKQIVEALHGGQ